ncbi:MAG: ABC transporter ATP-binding protein [Syntrophorhabdus sp.]|nr:ABC transporter ATP-binding protein [Syntrophorhabdus sp.]
MSKTVIKIEGVAKQYRLGSIGHGTLYRDVQSWLARIRGKEDPNSMIGSKPLARVEGKDHFWALRDINLEIRQGDTVGIIGRNGAGKSTLLKILSRVTAPTRGVIKVRGRIASLLEVGTGFHPELTGRENIYINGAILGMSKGEINRKFDEIVEFAGVELFVDTPVKRYSSGMYVRLAFAVAAHLEPEILLVDEVLAVGDVEFQNKCLGKMDNVAKEGRTVLFVSHNMGAIRNLCRRAVLLDEGKVVVDGSADEGLAHYLSLKTMEKAVIGKEEIEARMEGVILRNNPHIRFVEVGLYDANGEAKKAFYSNESIRLKIAFQCFKVIHDMHIFVYFTDEKGNDLLLSQQVDWPGMVKAFRRLGEGMYEALCEIPPNLFGGRTFYLSIHLEYPKTEHIVLQKILSFDVKFHGYNNVHIDYSVALRPQFEWQLQEIT